VQEVVNESWDADDDIRFKAAEVSDVAFGAHHFAATGAEHHDTTSRARVVSEPKSEVRREGKSVQETVFAAATADFDDAGARCSEVAEIGLGVEERRGFGAAAGGKSHENGPELGFEAILHGFTATSECAENSAGATREDFFVRNEDEVLEAEWMSRIVQQIGLGGKRQTLEIIQSVYAVRTDPVFFKKTSVITGEREDDSSQVAPESLGLQTANGAFRQLFPPAL